MRTLEAKHRALLGAGLCGALLVVASVPSSAGRPSTVSCDPASGVARVANTLGGHDYVTVAYRAGDNALWLENMVSTNSRGDGFTDEITCPNPGGTWKRVELDLERGKDSAVLRGGAPDGFTDLPASVAALIDAGKQIDDLGGHSGPDEIIGGPGRDYIRGYGGDDRLVGDRGDDELAGHGGDDRLEAADGIKDQVLCGKGDDTALVDAADNPKGCETVRVRTP